VPPRAGAPLQQRLSRFDRVEVACGPRHFAAPADVDQFRAGLDRFAWWAPWEPPRPNYLDGPSFESRRRPAAGHWACICGMTGQFLWLDQTPRDPCRHTPGCAAGTARQGNCGFIDDVRSFGKMWFIPSARLASSVMTGPCKKLGPENPSAQGFNGPYLQQKTQRAPSAQSRPPCLDQALVAGVGNIYAE